MLKRGNPPEKATTRTPSLTFDRDGIGQDPVKALERYLAQTASQEDAIDEGLRREVQDELQRRRGMIRNLELEVGVRYAACSIDSFVIEGSDEVKAKKHDAIARLSDFRDRLPEHRANGVGLFLYGPPGTGKDHFAIALLRHAILEFGMRVRWCNGQTLIGDFRDAIRGAATERELVASYTRPDILMISDPIALKGENSAYAASVLYRLIDERYRARKPTWITANVATKKEAADSLTGPIFDRLIHNAVTVFCNWPSYRQQRLPPRTK